MSTSVDIGALITRSPDVRNNRPCIAGTGVSVRTVVGLYKLGLNPEEISREMPHLTLAQVYAALTYYHANREEIERDIVEEETAADEIERQNYAQKRL